MKPLIDIKVVELGIWFAGPAVGMVLGECGADVIKMEPLGGGDPIRGLDMTEPRFRGSESKNDPPINYLTEMVNRNKRSIGIDLTKPEGKKIAHQLVQEADVFISNIRPQALTKLQMDPNTLTAVNPNLIYGLLTGFGPNGPDKNKPAFDDVGFWARGGLLSFMGEPESPPTQLKGAMGDLTTAMCLVTGITMALLSRERTGKGQVVDSSLLSSSMWVSGYDLHRTLFTGENPLRKSRKLAVNPLFNTYKCGDGRWVQFAMPQTDRFWGPTCRALGIPAMENDARFNSHINLLRHNQEAINIIDKILSKYPLGEWAPLFDEHQMIWSQDARLSEVIEDPQVKANQFLSEVKHPGLGVFTEVGLPFQLRETPVSPSSPAPEWSQHTEEVLQELGYSWDDICSLKDMEVVA